MPITLAEDTPSVSSSTAKLTQTPAAYLSAIALRTAHKLDLSLARELAGLSDSQLEKLAQASDVAPPIAESKRNKQLIFAGGGLLVVGIAGVVLSKYAGMDVLGALGAIALVVGMLLGVVCAILAYQRVPLERSHKRVKLAVNLLDEEHPWLYETLLLMRSPEAEAYRKSVLQDRGPLRGADYMMMDEISKRSAGMESLLTARSVKERVQALA